ncbi:MAG: class I SAM-dependent methyltransferase [Pseudonocardiales bacterium]|nr:class I SAM-dependent methyltransferase [Pseudonocardiales bacterium]
MTDVPRLTRLTHHGPLSDARAAAIVARLAATRPRTVLDVGCGWGALMLGLLEAVEGASGLGVDRDGDDLARGRADARRRGLTDRAEFADRPVREVTGPFDVVLCVGSSQALADMPGGLPEALAALHRLVAPGGRVLLGEGFWEAPPPPERLARMWPGAAAADHPDLAGLVDAAVAAGFRPGWVETASRDEWDAFESGYAADVEEWLVAHPGHPEEEATRARLDAHRDAWLRGYRGLLGMAYLTLLPRAR